MKTALSLLILVLVVLSGCATNQHDVAIEQAKYEFALKSQESANRPLFMVSCPASGCVFDKLAIANPNQKMATLPQETNGYDVINTMLKTGERVALGVTPYAAIGAVAVEGMKNAGDRITDSYNQHDASVSGSHNDGSDRSFNQDVKNDSETQTYANSNNETRLESTTEDSYNSQTETSLVNNEDSYNTETHDLRDSYNESSTVAESSEPDSIDGN